MSSAPLASPGGRRKTTQRKVVVFRSLPTVPMLPTLAGAAVVTAAAGGAIGLGTGGAEAVTMAQVDLVGAPVFSEYDTLGMSPRLDSRQHAMSRDSDRQSAQARVDEATQTAVQHQADGRTRVLSALQSKSKTQTKRLVVRNTWTLPTTGYHLTGRFGQSSGLWANNHTGLDFATTPGTPIVAVAGGTITETGPAGSYGNRTIETLPDGTELWYAHQLRIDVSPGQVVRSGEQIGEVGSTGNSTGPHVHLEVRPGGGDPVDPYTALIYHGLKP